MNKKLAGVVLATAVAGLMFSGKIVNANHPAGEGKVKCQGVNECKGKGSCHGANNACAGHNECKGKAWVFVDSEKACTDKGGTVAK